MKKVIVKSSNGLSGRVVIPPDKSLTHRAYIFASLAQGKGKSVIRRPLQSEDCEATKKCLKQLGVQFDGTEKVFVTAPEKLTGENLTLDCGNSGTSMRLLAGLIAGSPECKNITLTGDESLCQRPMKRITDPLKMMGAEIEGETAPLQISGKELEGIAYDSPLASAQVKSCILLAGLGASGKTTVTEPNPSRNHTENFLKFLGLPINTIANKVSLEGKSAWNPFKVTIPGDISSAAFFMIASALVPESEVILENVGLNQSRLGILDVFEQAGVVVKKENHTEELPGEPRANLIISTCQEIKPFEISGSLVPRLIDEIPVLAVLATQAGGTTIMRDAKELKVKESDRIAVMVEGLSSMGADIKATEDGMIITGPTPLLGATIDAKLDHRIAMSFAVAGLIAKGETTLLNADSVTSSFPRFFEELNALQS